MPRQLAPVPGDKGSGFVKSKSVLIALAEGVMLHLLALFSRQDSWLRSLRRASCARWLLVVQDA